MSKGMAFMWEISSYASSFSTFYALVPSLSHTGFYMQGLLQEQNQDTERNSEVLILVSVRFCL